MRLYPPLFFQRIWVKRFFPGFTGVEVVVNKSLLNTNYNNSIFGGTLFSAADPFYPVLFFHLLKRKGIKTQVWLKAAKVNYVKPARGKISFIITLNEEDIQLAINELSQNGKFISEYKIQLYDERNHLCTVIENEIYIKDLHFHRKLK